MTSLSAPRLSICMIVKNESETLPNCLQSIQPIADEIIVVDTGSDDNTLEIAKQYGAKVIESDWRDDFSYSRNISINHAKGSWILWLDADDIVPADSVLKIHELKKRKPDKVLGMVVRNQKPNGTGTEFIQARMFPNDPAIRFERPIHEQMMPSALKAGYIMIPTDVVIEHHGYADNDAMKKKAARNVQMLLKDAEGKMADPFFLIEIADSYTIMDEQGKAKEWYEKVLALPDSEKRFNVLASQAHYGLGNICNKKEEYTQVAYHFTRAAKLCPERTDALYCLAVSLEKRGEKSGAADALKSIFDKEHAPLLVGVDYRQTKIKAYVRLARVLQELDDKKELENLCTKALAKAGTRPEVLNAAGIAYYYLNRLIEALHCFEKSITIIKDSNIDAYAGLCFIYLKAGRRLVAEQTIISISPLFKDLPRYWALCEITGIRKPALVIPAQITGQQIEAEKEYLRRAFNIR